MSVGSILIKTNIDSLLQITSLAFEEAVVFDPLLPISIPNLFTRCHSKPDMRWPDSRTSLVGLGYSVIRGWSLVLYGTSIPPDPNDPPNVSRPYSTPPPALPPILPAAGFNSYTVSGGSKNYYSSSSSSSSSSTSASSSSGGSASSAGSKPNRKQQQLQYQTQYHQTGGGSSVSVQYGMTPAYGSTGTGSSSSSNSNRGNKGKNNKNKSNKNSSKTTTARPLSVAGNQQTTVNMYLNNYGGSGSGSSNGGGGRKNSSTKQKPLPPLQTINYGKGDKYHAATSNIQDKQVAIKAPKQVKQNGFQSAPSKSSPSSSSAPSSTSSSSATSSGGSSSSVRKTTTTTATTAAGGTGTSTTLSSQQGATLGGGSVPFLWSGGRSIDGLAEWYHSNRKPNIQRPLPSRILHQRTHTEGLSAVRQNTAILSRAAALLVHP
ncbi:uncharacterized protein DDB_G0271670-like [Anopheles stephensi]|uniref:uncharacterized protein DDB_G0271670-like n=1 Tax=Anopheles stephensi TaxID=30069 RepID=UPI001658A1E7|nr:uncharacterized protein DDB_G0271670-like [Anopheles stephensi]